jgi:hypothetical protein
MPRKAKAKSEAAPEAPKITKTQAIRNAVKANPKMQTKDIAAMLQAEGWDIKGNLVSVVRSNMGKGKRKKKAAAVAPAAEAAPPLPKDAVSVALLQKAKKMVKNLGGVKAAKQAIDALSKLMD